MAPATAIKRAPQSGGRSTAPHVAPPRPDENDDDESVTGSTPGAADEANASASNPSTEQVTQAGGDLEAPAEGQRIRDEADEDDGPGFVTLADVTAPAGDVVSYDETGKLRNKDGKPVALAADALDPDVGWTVQHAAPNDERDAVAYPGGPNETPDQTVHPDELPDPVAALKAGLLPQNVAGLNIDPHKFEGKKSLEA